MEQEEDEAGTVGDTFTDYVSVDISKLSIIELVIVGIMTLLTSPVPLFYLGDVNHFFCK